MMLAPVLLSLALAPPESAPPEPTPPTPTPAPGPAGDDPRNADADADADPQSERREHLLEGREHSVTGFGGPRLRPSAVGNDFGFLIGGGGAGVFGGRFIFGGEGYGMVAFAGDVGTRTIDGETEELGLKLGYGGLKLGWLFDLPGFVDASVQTLLAGGGVTLATIDRDDSRRVDSTGMFIAEPEGVLHIKVAKMFRLGVSAGYRFVAHGQWSGPSWFGLMGPSGAIILDWGSF